MFPIKRVVLALAAALYLYFLLPTTADAFFELYHLTHIEPVYWGYSGFKAASYYFGQWPYKVYVCIAVALAILLIPTLLRRTRS